MVFQLLQGDDVWDYSDGMKVHYNINDSGIDLVAAICTHELKHQENSKLEGTDTDEDGIPVSYELASPYKLDYNRPDTYNMAAELHPDYAKYGDDEFLARISEHNPGPRHPTKDWSYAGDCGKKVNKGG